jgi:hypothetical protein
MRNFGPGRRLATAAVIAAAAIGAAAPAQADYDGVAGKADRCEQGVEQLEQRFREIEAKHGYDAAVKWWPKAWAKYHDRCIV